MISCVTTPAADPWTYVVTDVELDGPWPGVHSMPSFRRAREGGTETHVPE